MVKVSIVMAVYNDESNIESSIDSILNQTYQDWELIIVNDGCTDKTPLLLDKVAQKDDRIKILEQKNMGLTHALIRGCQEAKGEYIARQDSGDISFPTRLTQQVKVLDQDINVSLVSSFTKFVAPQKEILQIAEVASLRFRKTNDPFAIDNFQMPTHHGNTMFRHRDYQKVGGYRDNFYYAQDRDLWIRLIEIGDHLIIPEILYQAQFYANSISGQHSQEQRQLKQLIDLITIERRKGNNQLELLKKASLIRKKPESKITKNNRLAEGYYFLGSCLMAKNDSHARYYLFKAIRLNPFYLKAYAKIIMALLQ